MGDIGPRKNRNVFEEIKVIIIKKLALESDDIAKVTPKASMTNDFGADSLDLADIMMALEEHFDVEIDNEEAEAAQNIGDIVIAINKLLQQKAS